MSLRMLYPAMTASPPEGSISPVSMLMEVVLPAPLGPNRPTHSPWEMAMVISLTASLGAVPPSDGNSLRRCIEVMTGIRSGGCRCRASTRATSALTSSYWVLKSRCIMTVTLSGAPPLEALPDKLLLLWSSWAFCSGAHVLDLSFRHIQSMMKSGCRGVPLPVGMTCSVYHASTMNTAHSTAMMIQTVTIPFFSSFSFSKVRPIVLL
mmetsp:Transcript_18891/g.52918  ORF Transcript_18891/g.52918 Transcript_18891/m.52918 type:complete len:207 (-) Transcript_18891:3313-3933(-)